MRLDRGKSSIATGDWRRRPRGRTQRASFVWLFGGQTPDGPLRLPQIIQRQLAGFDQVRHDRLRSSSEHRQEVVVETPLRGAPRDHRLEDMSVADLPDAADRLL